MVDDAKRTLTPTLRFPEFRETEGWTATILGSEGEFLSSLAGKTGQHFGTGSAKYITYMNVFTNTFADMSSLGVVDVGDDESQNEVENGDVLFTVSSETPEEVGMSSVVLEKVPNCYLNSFCALFRFTDDKLPNPRFLGYSLRQPLAREHFAQRAQGSTRFNLSRTAFRTLPLALPSLAEQQKIAECLTSLDEVIAAQGRKVAALAAHKRGLMQQLFPREGETVPRLRFPEFGGEGEWRTVTFGEIIEVASGQVDPTESPYRDFPQIGSENIQSGTGKIQNVKSAREKGVISGNYLFDENDILYSKIRPALNKVAAAQFKGICSADIYPIHPGGDDLLRSYLFYLLLSEAFLDYAIKNSARGKIPKINRDALLSFRTLLPLSAEQQRIADCLSSLDARIAAEFGKLAALKTHKKGLMQQLFPSPEGD